MKVRQGAWKKERLHAQRTPSRSSSEASETDDVESCARRDCFRGVAFELSTSQESLINAWSTLDDGRRVVRFETRSVRLKEEQHDYLGHENKL